MFCECWLVYLHLFETITSREYHHSIEATQIYNGLNKEPLYNFLNIYTGLDVWCLTPLSTIFHISWRSCLLVGETGVPGENLRSVTSYIYIYMCVCRQANCSTIILIYLLYSIVEILDYNKTLKGLILNDITVNML